MLEFTIQLFHLYYAQENQKNETTKLNGLPWIPHPIFSSP